MNLARDLTGNELRILIVEDEVADAELCEKELKRAGLRFTGRRVGTRAEFESALEESRPDLIIADFTLSGSFDGLTALKLARQKYPEVPLVLVSGTIGEERAVEAMKHGAGDYVLKDRMARLGPAVLRVLEGARLREEKELTLAALRESEFKYHELVDQASDGIFVTDRAGKILLANPRFCEMLGYSNDELSALNIAETYPEGERAVLPERFAQLAKVKARLFERMMRRKDGTCFPVEISVKFLANGTHQGIARDITQRKQFQTALVESEERFRAAFEQAGVGMALRGIDPRDSRWLRVNHKLCDILGYTREELLQLTSVDITPPEDRDLAIDYNEKLLKGEIASYSREKRYVRKDGRIIWADISLSAIRGPDGRPSHVISVVGDISERKRDEIERSRLAAIVDSSQDAIISRTLDGIILTWNAGAERMYGYTAAEAIGRNNRELLTPDDRRGEPYRNQALLAQGKPVPPYETTRRAKDGRRIQVWVSLSPILDRAGNTVAVSIITRDITALKRAEESQGRLAAIVEQSNDAIITRSLDGTITSWNTGAERLLGYSAGEAIGRSIEFTIPPGQRIRTPELRETVLRGEAVAAHETRRLTKDGRVIDVMSSISPLRDSAGDVIGASQILQDITARKQAEVERARLAAIVESSYDAIVSRGVDGKILSWNAAAERMFGWPAREAIGQSITIIIPPERRGELRPLVERVMRGETIGAVESTHLRKDGARIDTSVTLSATENAEGAVTGISLIYRDITERRLQERKIEKLSRVREVSSAINAAIVRIRDKQTLFEEACRIAVEQARLGSAWIGILDTETLDITPIAWAGEGSDEMYMIKSTARDEPPRGQGAVSRAVRERRVVINNDLSRDSFGGPRLEAVLKLGFRSIIALPLFEGDVVAGTLTLYAKESNFFDDEQVTLLTELAGNISFALEHIARQEKIEKLSRIRVVSSEINAVIVRIREREALLRETCRIAAEHGKFQFIWVALLDQEKQRVQPVAWAGFSAETAQAVEWASISAPGVTLAEVIQTRRLAVRNDIEAERSAGVLRREAAKKGCRSTVCLPFVVDQRVVAAMILFAAGRNFFVEDELALLNEMAGDISLALEHIARQEKIEKLSRIRAVLGEMNAAIVRIRDKQQLFNEACRIAHEHGSFTMAWIGLLDEATLAIKPAARAGRDEGYLDRLKLSIDPNVTRNLALAIEAVGRAEPVICNDVETDGRMRPWRAAALERGYRSIVMLPLVAEQRAVGVFALYSAEAGFFDEEEMKLLVELAGDITFALQTIENQEKLEFLSYYDALTGLPNRALFMDRAGQQLRSRGGEPLMVAMILLNLERFRNVNEMLGRHGGDDLLKLVARRLENAFRGKDYLARIGADGFGIVIRGIRDAAAVAHVVENQILHCFREPYKPNDTELRVAARAGIALYPADGADADTLFRNAEAALKRARESSERYLFYAADMNARAAQALSLETRLRKAVEAQQFVLHYQPKIELATGRICGLEALIRWQEPGAGLVAPGAFIPLLEETGLILEVGKWALGHALSQHRNWQSQGCPVPRIAVNVSAIQLQQSGFADMVIAAVREQGDYPDALELEVTESLLMKDVQSSIRKLSILRSMGIHIAMDDFGTGYSSLSYIARLPITSLKIDRSFINGMTGNAQDMAIVSTIIALAHSLNLRVVAEGVETEDQSKLLKLLKCDEAQGYLFSKPLPAADIEVVLRASA